MFSFFKKKSHELSDEEVKSLLEMLREAYKDGAKELSQSLFNVNAFNKRYEEALRQREDLTVFFAAEVGIVEDLRNKIKKDEEKRIEETKLEELKRKNSFSNHADAMLSAFEKMISKYPKKEIDPKAAMEIERLYGAMHEFYGCFILVKKIYSGALDYTSDMTLKDLFNKYSEHVLESMGHPPLMFQDYILAFTRPDIDKEVEKTEKEILKECGLLLNEVIAFLKELSKKEDLIDGETHTNIPNSFENDFPRVYKSFKNKTNKEIVDGSLHYIEAIVRDFRLHNFKRNIH